MWKLVTRTIRESLEKHSCRVNIYSQSVQEHSGTRNSSSQANHPHNKEHDNNNADDGKDSETGSNKSRSKSRCIISKFPSFYRSCAKVRYHGARDKEKQEKWDARRLNWSDAVSWTSIIAVGWMVCQSMCLQRKVTIKREKVNLDNWRRKLLTTPQFQASRLFKNLVLPQTNILLATCKASSHPSTSSEFHEEFLQNVSNHAKPYGPITVDEALQEIINEFSTMNKSVMGEMELGFGSEAIKEKRYKDAIEHFTSGAEYASIPSMFNLALCYELGLGTDVDFSKAAKYYQQAAEQGHTDAMYNLGIFYAQGKGGLSTNLDAARQWFKQAAEQGHRQAEKALELEKSAKRSETYDKKVNYNTSITTLGGNARNIINKLSHYKALPKDKKVQTTNHDLYDDGASDMSPTDTFLELLGVCEKRSLVNSGENGL